MAKFIYKFDSIIRIKEVLEKKVLKEISLLEKEIEYTNMKITALIEHKSELHNKINAGLIKAYEYKSGKAHFKSIEREIYNLEKKSGELKQRKQNKLNELIQRKKEKKIFETLKEKKLEEFNIDYNRAEMKDLNEIAISNFVRKEL